MRYQPGHKKSGGRKKGTLNRVTVEIKELARNILEDPVYQERLRVRINEGKAERIEVLLFHYAYGRPAVSVAGGQGATLEELLRPVYDENLQPIDYPT